MNARSFVWIVLLALSTGLLSGCGAAARASAEASPTPETAASSPELVVAEGKLLPEQRLDLAFAAGGRVEEVLVSQGQVVEAGQVLARLEGAEIFRAQEAAARLEIVQVEQALRDLQDDTILVLAGASADLEAAREDYDELSDNWDPADADAPTDFETALLDYIEAEEAVREAQADLNEELDRAKDAPARQQAQEDLQREQKRREQAYEAVLADYEDPQEGGETDDRTELVQAIARLEAARLRLEKLAGGADPDQSELLQARLEAAQAAQAAAQKGLRDLELHAPWSGVVVYWDLKAGQEVAPAQVVGALADLSAWLVETSDLTENSVVRVAVGDLAQVTVNALAGETFTGVVESIGGKGEKYQGDMTYPVRIRMDQVDPRWFWNMNVKVTLGE